MGEPPALTPASVPGLEEVARRAVSLAFLPRPENYTGHHGQPASWGTAAATTGIVVAFGGELDVRGIALPR